MRQTGTDSSEDTIVLACAALPLGDGPGVLIVLVVIIIVVVVVAVVVVVPVSIVVVVVILVVVVLLVVPPSRQLRGFKPSLPICC